MAANKDNSLVAATNKIKGGVWFMFGLVTFIQMIGNIFYSYYQIDESGDLFQAWIELTAPIWELMGTETTDIVGMKRWLAFLEGGLLPLISLTSLHFFVTYEKNDESNSVKNTQVDPNEGITPEMKEVIVAEEKKRQNEEIKKKVVEVENTPTEEIIEEKKSQKAKNIVESFGLNYEFDDGDFDNNPLT